MDDENIVKKTCKELGISIKELGEKIGVKEQSLRNSSSSGNISLQVEKAILLLIENHALKEQLSDYLSLKEALKNITK